MTQVVEPLSKALSSNPSTALPLKKTKVYRSHRTLREGIGHPKAPGVPGVFISLAIEKPSVACKYHYDTQSLL
jgi:hypothetical protein